MRPVVFAGELALLGLSLTLTAPVLAGPDAALLALAPELERRCAECPRLWAVKWEDDTMTNTATETRSVVVEREIPFPPEKI